MAKKYNGGIPTVTSFRIDKAEPISDNQIVTLLADLTSTSVLEYPYKGMKVYVEENGNTYEWNGLDRTNVANWVDKLTDEIERATAAELVLTNAVNAVTSGIQYTIPQAGNTPTTEPTPTENGIYRVKTINVTYTNFDGIGVPNDAGFIYDIQVSGLPSTPVYTLLSTDVNITIDAVPTSGSTNAVQSGGSFDALADETTARNEALALKADITSVHENLKSIEIEKRKSIASLNLFDGSIYLEDATLTTDLNNIIGLTGVLNVIKIFVQQGEQITVTGKDFAWFTDLNGIGIGSRIGYENVPSSTYTATEDGYFFRVVSDIGVNNFQLVLGDVLPSPKDNFKLITSVINENIDENADKISVLDTEKEKYAKYQYDISEQEKIQTSQLFDKTKFIVDKGIQNNSTNPTIDLVGKNLIRIPVIEGRTYRRSVSDWGWFVDVNDIGIGSMLGYNVSPTTITAPSSSVYFIGMLSISQIQSFLFVEGSQFPTKLSENLASSGSVTPDFAIQNNASDIFVANVSKNILRISINAGDVIERSISDWGWFTGDDNVGIGSMLGYNGSPTTITAPTGATRLHLGLSDSQLVNIVLKKYITDTQPFVISNTQKDLNDLKIELGDEKTKGLTNFSNPFTSTTFSEIAEKFSGTAGLNAGYKIPIKLSNEFTISFDFFMEDDINNATSNRDFLKFVSTNDVPKELFNLLFQKRPLTTSPFAPIYNSYFEAILNGVSSNDGRNSQFEALFDNNGLGVDSFSIRKLNSVLADTALKVEANLTNLVFYNGSTVISSFSLSQPLDDLLDAIEADVDLTDYEIRRYYTANLQGTDLAFNSINLVKETAEINITSTSRPPALSGNTVYDNWECFFPLSNIGIKKTCKIVCEFSNGIDNTNGYYFYFYIDDIVIYNSFLSPSVFSGNLEGNLYLGGASDTAEINFVGDFSNFKIENKAIKPPYQLTLMAHYSVSNVEIDGSVPDNAPGGDVFTISTGRLARLLQDVKNRGFVFSTLEDMIDMQKGSKLKEKAFTIIFDDNRLQWFENLEMRSLIQKYGVKPQVCIYLKSPVDWTTDDFQQKLKFIKQLGYGFHFHCNYHSDASYYTFEQLKSQYLILKNSFEANGWISDIWTYAYGTSSKQMRKYLKNNGIKAAYTTGGGVTFYNTESLNFFRLYADDDSTYGGIDYHLKGRLLTY